MRKIPRGLPLVTIANRDLIIREYGDVENCANAYYMTNPNSIEFNNCKFETEDSCMLSLIHELNHWAQFMFLDAKEMDDIYTTYEALTKDGKTPFVEWINPVKAFYDYTEWKTKYPGRDFFMDLEWEGTVGKRANMKELIPWPWKIFWHRW